MNEPFLAGVKTISMIHYVCVGSSPTNVGWTPYAAMAERWENREDAETAAKSAQKKFNLKGGGTPVIQKESDAFKTHLKYETVS